MSRVLCVSDKADSPNINIHKQQKAVISYDLCIVSLLLYTITTTTMIGGNVLIKSVTPVDISYKTSLVIHT